MVNSPIKAEDLATEFSVVRNEFEMGENSPERVFAADGGRGLRMAQLRQIHHRQPHRHRAGAGRQLAGFYKKFYQPDNAMLVVAGKFAEPKAIEYVNKYFGAPAPPDASSPRPTPKSHPRTAKSCHPEARRRCRTGRSALSRSRPERIRNSRPCSCWRGSCDEPSAGSTRPSWRRRRPRA